MVVHNVLMVVHKLIQVISHKFVISVPLSSAAPQSSPSHATTDSTAISSPPSPTPTSFLRLRCSFCSTPSLLLPPSPFGEEAWLHFPHWSRNRAFEIEYISEMAAQTDISYVGHAFVRNFYQIMHHTPEFVHQFYKDSSTMRRPGPNGLMVTVNARKGIKDLILSLNYKDFKADILTTFAHAHMNGVVIFVMGCMTGKNCVKRNFTELFFLAPQDVGFFVLLDTFRFIDVSEIDLKSPPPPPPPTPPPPPPPSAMPVEEMAMGGASVEVNPETLGHAFVRHYYSILHKFPEGIHEFYKDSSTMNRPGPDGTMVTVTAKKGIKDLMLSLNCKDYKSEILTIDAHSYGNGVVILVTGCLTGKDNFRRNFTESFCLAPQETGFFISNDTFRFMGENGSAGVISMDAKSAAATAPPVIPVGEMTETKETAETTTMSSSRGCQGRNWHIQG